MRRTQIQPGPLFEQTHDIEFGGACAIGLHGLFKQRLRNRSHRQRKSLRAGHLIDQAEILATQRERKTRVVVAGKNRRHIVLGHPAIARAGLDRFPYRVQRNAGFRAQHQAFTDGGGTDKPQQIGQQLDRSAVAMRANIKDFFAQHVEDWFVLVETFS